MHTMLTLMQAVAQAFQARHRPQVREYRTCPLDLCARAGAPPSPSPELPALAAFDGLLHVSVSLLSLPPSLPAAVPPPARSRSRSAGRPRDARSRLDLTSVTPQLELKPEAATVWTLDLVCTCSCCRQGAHSKLGDIVGAAEGLRRRTGTGVGTVADTRRATLSIILRALCANVESQLRHVRVSSLSLRSVCLVSCFLELVRQKPGVWVRSGLRLTKQETCSTPFSVASNLRPALPPSAGTRTTGRG